MSHRIQHTHTMKNQCPILPFWSAYTIAKEVISGKMLKFALIALGVTNVLADVDVELNLTTTTFNLNEANKHLWLSAAGMHL